MAIRFEDAGLTSHPDRRQSVRDAGAHGDTRATIRPLLGPRERQARRHTGRTLGFVDDDGRLEFMRPETVSDILGGASTRLEFVFLNGCGEAMCVAVCNACRRVPVVGWRTIANDDAASVASIAFGSFRAAAA